YFAAYLWLLYTVLLLAWWAARSPKRAGPLLCCAVILVVFLPMAVYGLQHPSNVFERMGTVRVRDLREVVHNLRSWALAWFPPGNPKPPADPLRRPILDAWSGALFLLGLVALPSITRKRWQSLWIAGWAAAALLPSLLSVEAPHSLRGVGLTVPISLVTGAGAIAVARRLRTRYPRLGLLIPGLLLAASGAVTGNDLRAWLHEPDTMVAMEAHIGQAINWLSVHGPVDRPVYFSPFSPGHPVLVFRGSDLRPRPVRAFDSHQCLVLSEGGATYVSLTAFEPDFADRLEQWTDVQVLARHEPQPGASPLYVILEAAPRAGALGAVGEAAAFDDALTLRPLAPLPAKVQAGESLRVCLAARALHPLDRPYSVFVHLYGDPTPYEGGPMWSQGDCQLCASYPTVCWQPDETVVQEFSLTVPPSAPPGRYLVAVGVYEAPAGPRLPVTAPAPQPWDYVSLGEIEVVAGR
ncbi:MAG: hypothetical protein QME94_08775, partial [Anaerolineae bacterium]|nr:hypothetical protein [Anaerolineae bacterium]